MKKIIYMQTSGRKEVKQSALDSVSYPIADYIYLVFENDILISSVNLCDVNRRVISQMFPDVEIIDLKG
jgi:hypothetical protein